jgi:two-component system heavy metal sensor histidine kinase CusS
VSLKNLSLTARMSLMFMSAVIIVLAVAGLSFNLLSQHHFSLLDRQALEEKLSYSKRILRATQGNSSLSDELTHIGSMLENHQGLAISILASDGTVLFSDSRTANIPAAFRHAGEKTMWQWQDGAKMYRGMTAQVPLNQQSKPLTVLLILDVTTHAHFFDTLQRWFWIGLSLSALASALIGWLVARSGLKPLRQVTHLATLISARSLQERIPLEPVPLELRQLALSFNAMLARLEESFMRLSNFSADIAHELRTPVSNLMTQTEVVLSQKRGIHTYEENLYSNLEELKRMSHIIDDMLFLAKADNGLVTPERKRIELVDVVAKLFEFYRFLADENGVQLEVSGAGDVQGDKLMLDRAISNLLSNALRYTPVGSTVSVLIQQSAQTVTLIAQNPGPTIEREHLAKLFDRFYRGDPARREGTPANAGLGLAITRSIVETHGGRIWCTSEAGITSFHMQFPRPGTVTES